MEGVFGNVVDLVVRRAFLGGGLSGGDDSESENKSSRRSLR